MNEHRHRNEDTPETLCSEQTQISQPRRPVYRIAGVAGFISVVVVTHAAQRVLVAVGMH